MEKKEVMVPKDKDKAKEVKTEGKKKVNKMDEDRVLGRYGNNSRNGLLRK